MKVFRRRRPADPLDEVDPRVLGPRWSGAVGRALGARRYVAELIERAPPGPVADRLHQIGSRVDAGVLAAWHTAQRADQLTLTLGGIDVGRATAEHKQAKRELQRATELGQVTPAMEERAEALAERHASVQRMLNSLDDADERLGVIDARLDAAVLRVAEISMRPDATAEVAALESELDAVVDELGALRAGLDEVGRLEGGTGVRRLLGGE